MAFWVITTSLLGRRLWGLLGGGSLLTTGRAGSFCSLTGQPSMVFPPGKWLYPGMQRQIAAPEGANSQLVFSPHGEGEQPDWAATAIHMEARATSHRRDIMVSQVCSLVFRFSCQGEPKCLDESEAYLS